MTTNDLITAQVSGKLRGLVLMLAIMVVMAHSATTCVFFADGKVEMASRAGVWVQLFFYRLCMIIVPTFYLISGLLFFATFKPTGRELIRKYRSRVVSLLAPYLAWSALAIGFFWLVQSLPSARVLFPNSEEIVADMSSKDLAKTWLTAALPVQLWFMRYLMLMVAAAPLVYVLLTRLGVGFLVVVFAVWLSAVADGMWHYLVEAIWFFSLGAYIAIRRTIRLDSGFPFAWLLLPCWLAMSACDVYLGFAFRSSNPLRQATILIGVAGVWLNWQAFRFVFESAPARRAAKYAFFIYAAHMPAVVILVRLVVLGVGRNDTGLAVAAIVSPIVVIGCILLGGWALRKLCPPAYSLLSGGR